MASRPETLQTFANFCTAPSTGDEQGEAQVFLDRFFRAFDHGAGVFLVR
ncbi:MAG: hypothetical protein HC812_10310 [Leptolyngbya sp. RL_3_1]|nr:hypothetical protein [Leptolyngbya sp. RL_3_1]